ncbi:DUF6716 putative glycosyltransferase [Agrobacterium arsenijevicii]|uniref:DUF6716 putative glycosyltransferase n=1 Tax=Agrobacterium arsenijevicii TaxID=1585697 RepID=UPI003305FBD2
MVLVSYDSFLNVGKLIGSRFEQAGCAVDVALVKTGRKNQISSAQINILGQGQDIPWISIPEFLRNPEFLEYNCIFCCLEGLSIRRLIHSLTRLTDRRPLIVCAYPGLLLRDAYDGLAMRSGCDLVWLNSTKDIDAYRKMCDAFGISAGNARLFGVAPLLQKIERSDDDKTKPVVFFEQAVIPRHYDERVYLARQLVILAKKFPDRQFIIKLRATGDDVTLHQPSYPLDPLLIEAAKSQGGWPQNLRLSSKESAVSLLAKASHCLTISSTVSVQAIKAGIPTAIIGDYGAREEYGLNYFFGSGLITTFDKIRFPFEGKPEKYWWSYNVEDPDRHIARLISETIELAASDLPELSPQSLAAEFSPELRRHFLEVLKLDDFLARKYERPKNDVGITRKLMSRLLRRKRNRQ